MRLCKTEHANLCGRRQRSAAAQRLCNRDMITDGETGERVGTAYECCVTQGAARTCRKNGARLFRVSKFWKDKKGHVAKHICDLITNEPCDALEWRWRFEIQFSERNTICV